MTISSTTNRWAYAGNGVTVLFAYTNKIFAKSDLLVYRETIADGALTLLTLNTHYDVTGVGVAGGGNVDLTALGAPSGDYRVIIVRQVPLTQETDLEDDGPFPADTTEQALDKLTVLAQQIDDTIGRSLRQPDNDTTAIARLPRAAERASMYLAFDGDGNPVASAAPEGGNVVSAFMATVLDADTAAAARTTLEAMGAGDDGTVLTGLLQQGRQVLGCWGAEVIRPQTSNGCASIAWEESSTNKVMTPYLAFDKDAIEYGQFKFRAPAGLDESAGLSARFVWKEASGASAHDCIWQIEMQAQGDGDTIDSAWGTAVTVSDTGSSGTRRITPETGEIEPGGSWAAGDEIQVRVSRKATDGADTLDVDAHLIEVVLFGTYAAATEPA
jgi:hypothetical protein